jgi:hypothetical protein
VAKQAALNSFGRVLSQGDFNYGTRDFNLRPVYARLVKTWLADRLRLGLKATENGVMLLNPSLLGVGVRR